MKLSQSRFLNVRGIRYYFREWGTQTQPKLFMLHGWRDASVSFQFIVNALTQDWHIIAPDWRGFGHSAWDSGHTYWFPDYLADLDSLLDLLQGNDTVTLLGHSMGGNIAALYAGIRPHRVSHLILLDAFGLPDSAAKYAPKRYQLWLDQLKTTPSFRAYPDFETLAKKLQSISPNLASENALWLAQHLAIPDNKGHICPLYDPAHEYINPILYRREEALACWQRITAEVLVLEPKINKLRQRLGIDDTTHTAMLAAFQRHQQIILPSCSHNLHHDQPEIIARTIESFLTSSPIKKSICQTTL